MSGSASHVGVTNLCVGAVAIVAEGLCWQHTVVHSAGGVPRGGSACAVLLLCVCGGDVG